MRALTIAAILLCAAPAWAAEGRDGEGDGWQDPLRPGTATRDGVYRGDTELVSGSYNCRGFIYTLTVTDRFVRITLTPRSNGVGGSFEATLREDGTIGFSYSAVGGSGLVNVALTLDGEVFTGYSQSMSCRYKVTATRS